MRVPPDPGGRAFLLALVIAGLLLAGWEGLWRSTGVDPSVGHGDGVWSQLRATLPSDAIALIGTSRIQAGVSPAQLAEELGRPVVQLAILGASPVPILEDLAADPDFRGLAVVDLVPRVAFASGDARETQAYAQLARRRQDARPSSRIETALRMELRKWLVSQRPDFSITALLTDLARGRLPSTPYVSMRANRFRELDFERVDPVERETALLRQIENDRPASAEERDRVIARIESAVAAIRARGGAVVFLHMPADGRVRELERERFPRERYWDVFAREIDAPTFHYEDVPQLAGFRCPDGSHLDQRDVERFTDALARLLAPYVPR